MEAVKVEHRITNIVAVGKIKSCFEKTNVVFKETGKFKLMRTNVGPVRIQIYETGSILLLGAISIDQVFRAFEQLTSFLKNQDPNLSIVSAPVIRNVVTTFELGADINYREFHARYRETWKIRLELEMCRGMVITKDKQTMILFASGKGIITGATSFEQSEKFLNEIRSCVAHLHC